MLLLNSACLMMISVSAPSSSDWALIDGKTGLWPLLAIVVLLTYYLIVYRVILAVPSRGTIVPRYRPPANVSPAMLRFLERKTFDEKAFAAAVLDLAARGYMGISGGKSKPYVFSRLQADDSALPADEIALASLLFHDESALRIDLGHREAIQFAKQTMAK